MPADLRLIVAEALGALRATGADLTALCAPFGWEPDAEVRTASALAYYRRLQQERTLEPTEVDDLRAGLRAMLGASGLDHAEQRQAAAAALIDTGHAPALNEVHEGVGDDVHPAWIELGRYDAPNRALVRVVLQHWEVLERAVGSPVLARFVNPTYEDPAVPLLTDWEWVAPVLDEHPVAARALLRFIDEHPMATFGPNTLQFVARHRPGTQQLRDLCVAATQREDRPWGDEWAASTEVAAEILAGQYAHDAALWAEIGRDVELRPPRLGSVVALARAQPDSPALTALWMTLEARGEVGAAVPALVQFHLLCAAGSTSDVRAFLERFLDRLSRYGQQLFRWLYRPLVARLRRDPSLASALGALAAETSSAVLAGSVWSALVAVAGLLSGEDLSVRLATEQRQHTLVYDLRTGECRPLTHVILDALDRRPA